MYDIITLYRYRLVLAAVLGLLALTGVACASPPLPAVPSPAPTASPEASPTLPPVDQSPAPISAPEASLDSIDGETIAVLTFVEGDVELEGATASRTSGLALEARRKARPHQQVRSQTVINPTGNARATVVCNNDRAFATSNGRKVKVGQGCQSGSALPKESLCSVRPDNGHFCVNREGQPGH